MYGNIHTFLQENEQATKDFGTNVMPLVFIVKTMEFLIARPGEKQTVPVVPSGRYCVIELPMGVEFDSSVDYSTEFIAEDLMYMMSLILVSLILMSLIRTSSSVRHNYYVASSREDS